MSIKVGLEYIGYIDPWTDEERLTDEEIVRCRDCMHFTEGHQSGVVWGGRTPDWCVLRDYPTKGDGFCHKGMRRDA